MTTRIDAAMDLVRAPRNVRAPSNLRTLRARPAAPAAPRRADRLGGIRIRPIRPTDEAALRAFYAGLSEESRRTRFLGPAAGIGRGQSAYFCTPDHAHREGFVASAGGRIVGHVCVEPEGPSCAEIAVAVADELQGRGLGRALVGAAVDWARRDGYETLCATMLGGNPAIQRLLSGLGIPSTTTTTGAGTIEMRMAIGATGGSRGHAAA
jgi:GNAT superfamily N-acetyltransferase